MFKSVIRTTGLFVVLTVLLVACQPIQRLSESNRTSSALGSISLDSLSAFSMSVEAKKIGLVEACREFHYETKQCDWGDKNDQKWCRRDRLYAIGLCIGDRAFAGDSCWPHWANGGVQGYECTNEHTCLSVKNYLWYVEEKNFEQLTSDCSNTKKLYYWK